MPFQSTKTYGHEVGLSACFRQHGAVHSHCSLIHGYALAVTLTFEAEVLDSNGWVMDFGGLKPVKQWLQDNFDHKLLVADRDPHKDELCALAGLGLADVRVVPRTGCEAFAFMISEFVNEWLFTSQANVLRDLRCVKVEVSEHGGNSAIYYKV